MSKSKRIFVTGGTGFIGSSLIHKLVGLGHEVASFDANLNFIENPPYYEKSLKLRKKHFTQASKKYKGDVRDFNKVKKAMKDFKAEVVVHLAGLPMARVLDQYKEQMVPINMIGTLNTVKAFNEVDAERIVYTSSSMTYGHFKQTPQTENFILDPVNEYGATKAAGEYFIKLIPKEWVIIRPTSVYGFADCANRVSQLLIDAAILNKPAWVVQGETLDFSYIEDVTDGFVKACLLPAANQQTFNISRGEARSAEEFAMILKDLFPNFEYEVRQPNKQQVWRGPLDIQKARTLLKFDPKYSLEKGIAETLELIEKYHFYDFAK